MSSMNATSSPADAGRRVVRAQRVQVLLPCLVHDLRTLVGRDERERPGDGLVERLRAEAAADHQQPERPAAPVEALFRRRDRRDLRAHRDFRSTRPCFNAPGKATIALSATAASTRLASPATAFCSCTASGRASSDAIMPPGKAT